MFDLAKNIFRKVPNIDNINADSTQQEPVFTLVNNKKKKNKKNNNNGTARNIKHSAPYTNRNKGQPHNHTK